MNITKIILTRCQIFHLKCTKFNFGWALRQTPLEELPALPDRSWSCGGKEKRERGKEGKETRKGEGRET